MLQEFKEWKESMTVRRKKILEEERRKQEEEMTKKELREIRERLKELDRVIEE